MALTKKVRFEVFKRDGFACCYCGKTPPTVILEVDHIEPKSKGGSDDINNLITACFDCNRGKKDIALGTIPSPMNMNLEVIKEKEEQLAEYNQWVKRSIERKASEREAISAIYHEYYPQWTLNEKFKYSTLDRFLDYLPAEKLKENMRIACNMGFDQVASIKYFCGICWRQIKQINKDYGK